MHAAGPSFSSYGASLRSLSGVKAVSVDEFAASLKTGDLVFSRSDSFTAHLIQFSGHCIWNHVAMIVFGHWCEATNDDTVYDISNSGVERKNPRCGVKIWDIRTGLSMFLKKYPGSLFFGVSHSEGTEEMSYHKQLWQFWLREQGKPYTPDHFSLLLSWFDGLPSITNLCCWQSGLRLDSDATASPLFQNKSTQEHYFCSQVVVECLRQSGTMIGEEFGAAPNTEWTVADLANVNYKLKNNLYNNFKYTEIEFFSVQ